MDVRKVKDHGRWLASYRDDQCSALIECLMLKITQQEGLINRINGEIELTESPKEESEETIINSIKDMIDQKEEINVTKGYFTWIA